MVIYTDGSAHPNPGPGGFGVVVLDNDENLLYTYNKQFEKTTNNEMELKAILYTMINYGSKNLNEIPTVYSDSSYAINTLTNWIFSWQRNGWIKSDKKTPENLEIIKAYYDLYQMGFRIDLKKVRGHSGNRYNDLADKLATGKI